MTKDDAVKFLEDLGAKVEWPKMPKGPVMEPVDGRGYCYAVLPPRTQPVFHAFSISDPMHRLYWETGRIFHTEPEAKQRMKEDQDKMWKMVHIPTLADAIVHCEFDREDGWAMHDFLTNGNFFPQS